ncbi:hypothetical protein GJ496_008674 [Pomphorhynchus laevis]|nr:hypothetical protein GJ496_008674 [Pomphorhynchus laevis]
MRAFPSYSYNRLKIRELYVLEKYLFNINCNGTRITFNEYFTTTPNMSVLVLCGLFYINWLTIPFGFALYLYLHNKYHYLKFSIEFLLLNCIGFIIYYIYPAAPPWYVNLYGFEQHLNVKGNAASLSILDDLIGVNIFRRIYSQNTNVFASM